MTSIMVLNTEEDTGYREFKLKLSKIKERMLTAEGRRIAEERHAFMASSRPWVRRAEGYRETRHVIPSGQVAVTPRRPPFPSSVAGLLRRAGAAPDLQRLSRTLFVFCF